MRLIDGYTLKKKNPTPFINWGGSNPPKTFASKNRNKYYTNDEKFQKKKNKIMNVLMSIKLVLHILI